MNYYLVDIVIILKMNVKYQINKASVQESNYNNEFPCINAMKNCKDNTPNEDVEFVAPNNWDTISGKCCIPDLKSIKKWKT